MSIAEFITTIRNQGVQIKFHDGALKVALPKEINPEVKSELVRRKEEIKAYLGGQLTTTTQSEITLSDQPKSRRPLSVAQQRLWFIAQMEPLSSSYNMPLVLNIKGAFSVAYAERALLEIMARHEVLRTSYHEENGEVYQRLNPVPECLIESIDMRSVAESDRQQQVEAVIQETTRRPFELSSSPLLRVYWIQCSASQSDTQQGYLLLNLHHIAADAWSMEVLFDEFNFYYQQFSSASQAALPALELQYSDYAIWQASYLDEQTLQAQQNYWLEQLKGIPAVHSLPLDFVRPAKLTSQGSHYSLPLTREVAAAIADLAKRFHTTPFVIFHAAWSLLLARHSHEQDIVIGTPVAGRTHPQLGRLIGLFVNTLVLRAEVDESATLAEYVAALKAVNLAAQQHQDIPLDQVVDVLNPPRSQSHNPVFQIMLNMLQGNATKSTSSQATGSELSVTQSDDGQSNVVCDLILNVIEQDQQFELKFEYNTGLFTTQRIVMLAEQLSVLLAQMGQQPEQRLSTYTMLSPSAAEALCHPKPAYQPSRSSATTIHQLFEQQAHLNPEHEALCWADGAMSYAQLNARANRLAHTLITQYQVRAGDLVGICSPKTPELIVAILAVLKAGAGYVPLAPDFPVERIELMVADTQARLVLSCAEMFDSLTQLAVSTVTLLLNEQTEHTDSYPPANPVVDELTPDHLAYVIYTSGSTGQPKGVMVEHRNVMALLSQPSFIESASARRVASLSSYAFDGFVFDMFYPLLRGQTLVLLDKSEILDERVLNQRLCELRVEAFFATTSLFNQMVINDTFRGTSIKAVLMGGEQASAEVVQQALTRYPDIRFTNAYGPTETTVFACAHHFSDPIGRVPIGRAINDTQVFVLNNDLQPVATGVIAQLYIGGPTLARGYLNQPELSAERFIDNPYFDAQQPHSSARLYQTGDLVRRLPDGALEFIGRVDEQVKIRGFRIELGEIAQQMMRLPAVESAVVLVKELAQGKQLVAYVQPVAMPEQSDDYIAQLRERLCDSLPAYMIPSVIMLLPALPLTHNGKLDKRALPTPEMQLDESACVAPVTPLEKTLVGIWSEMLNIPEPQLSTEADFFALGGHSLLAVRLIARIREQLGRELTIKQLFDQPSIKALADELSRQETTPARPSIISHGPNSRAPLSFSQQRLWFIDQLQSGVSTNYNLPMVLRLHGPFEPGCAEQALSYMIARHEILRTVYHYDGQEVEQVIQAEAAFTIERMDLQGLSAQAQQAACEEAIERTVSQAFDLSCDIPIRATWVALSPQQGVLIFNMHHIASDGWSMGVLAEEFSQLYRQACAGEPLMLAPLDIQYGDYARWQRTYLQGQVLDTQLNYWLAHLAEVPPVHGLALDRPRGQQASEGALFSQSLDSELAEQLRGLCQRLAITPFMLLHGILSLVLARHSGSHDIVVGTPVANRLQAQLAPLIGFFVNTLVLRVNTAGHTDIQSYLAHIKDVHLAAQSHQDVPFEQLVEHLQLPRDTGHNPLVQILFSMDEDISGKGPLALGDIKVEMLEDEQAAVKCDLDISAGLDEQGLHLSWLYDSALFDRAHIAQLQAHFERLLRQAVTLTPGRPDTFRLLSQAEQSALLAAGEGQQAASDVALLPTQFSAQAGRHGSRIALQWQDQTLSYDALEQRANQLARLLRERGVGAEQRVGIYLPRSIDMVVAMLGVLKAGGAYVPIDPAYPQQRVAHILADTEMAQLLTHSDLAAQLTTTSVTCIALDEAKTQACLRGYSDTRLDITVEPEDLAYVIYTSGSTGTPKGVMVEHHAVAAHIHCVTQYFGFNPSDNILQLTSFAFDTFIEQTWAALISGGTVILSERLLSVDDFFASVARFGVTITDLPPAYLAECLLPEYTAQWQTSTLRLVVIGGEAVSAQTLQRWFELGLPHCKLINGYGPTEAVVTATVQELELQDTSEPRIGTVFGPRRLYVLDADQQLVPSGCVGELYIGGAALARGYLNRPEETQQRFLPDPFNAGTRMYRTGDLVAYDKAHALRYLGRVDDQVKIRGYRIEVQEVAHRIAELDGVQEAFVMVQQQDGHKCLVGYFQPTHDASSCDADWIKQQLLQSLPDYMVPATILAVPQWPLNHNGKIDKQRLPVAQQAPSVQVVVAPKTPTEQQLLEIWQRILPASGNEFGTQESFFELGGHSLLVVRMVAQIREKMALDVAIKSVFEYPTISSLSAYIERLSPDSAEQSEIKPIARDRAHYPVSFAQQRLWFIDKMDGGSAQYNMPMAFRVHGAFCVQSAQTALNRIIARHESLRTNFIDTEQGPAQLVHPQRRLSVTIVDLTETHNPEQEINQFLHQDALRVFDLQADLLMRASYLSLPHQSGIFVLNMHHIVSDGWSLGNLSREFLIQYQSVCHDTPDPLSPLAIQYPDYASWQRTWISAERLDQQLAFWQSQLDGLPATHSIPLDHPRPQEKGLHGSACISHLTQQQVEGLQQLALRSRSTLFMVLHSVLATLIAKLSNNSDVVIATPVANRQSSQLEPLIGFFVNTLVLRVNAKHDTFSALLRHVTEVNLAAQQHQDVPFDYLVEHCQITRSKQHTPVFQIMFSMDTSDDGTDEMAMQDVTFEALEGLANTAKFDLDISAEQGADGMAMQWNYDTSIFNHETVVRMAEQFGKLVEQVVHQPDLPMGQISLLDAQTKESLLQASQGAKHELSQQLSLPALLLRQAQATPAAPCLITAQQQWNYQQFNTLTNQLARYLSGMGIEPGCRVALTATRSAINLQLLVAIMKLGAVYVPIDLSWPAARLDYIIEAADIRCVISEPLAESLALPCEHWVITADILDSEVAQQTPSDLTLPVGLSDLAYILFTSGTSGVPKGVMQTHRTLVNLALDMQSQGIDGAKRTLLFTPMTFDVSLQELACAWQTGSALVSITQSQKDDLPQLANLLEQLRIERAFMPPAVLQLLSETAHSQGHTLADLQQVIVAGEALYLSDEIRQLLHRCNHLQLWNHYGPTETHVVTSKRVDSVQDPIAVPIGAPIANCAAYILDDYHQLVPHGTSGELYLAGAGLAAGYLDPGQTQAAFVASLNPELPHQVLYKSGDIARFNHLSEIEYLSRNDEQIQLRGYRVELSEIETHLLALPWVQQAVVQVSNVGKADAALVAYVVAEDTAQSAELVTKIKAALSDSLPAYMIPSVIMLLPALPLTHNGKLDKRALPTPEMQLDESACVAPVTPLEKTLVGIWSEMLNIPEPQLSTEADFFALGGHSLLAVRLIARIREQLGRELTIKQLFDQPSIKALADELSRQETTPARPSIISHGPNSRAPLSFSQQRLWFIDQLQSGVSTNYNLPMVLRLHGPFEPGCAEQALSYMIARHEILRTVYHYDGQEVEQVIQAEAAFTIERMDLQGLSAQAQQAACEEAIERTVSQAFDLSCDIPIRATWVALSPQQGVLIFNMHHIASDGWSMGVLAEEFSQLYRQACAGEPLMLAPLDIQYGDYARWQRTYLQGQVLDTQLNYWLAHLAEVPPVHGLALDRPRGQQASEGALFSQSLDSELAEQLRGLCQRLAITPFMLLHGILSLVLARHSGSHDIVVGTPVANRLQAQLAPLIGFFVNTLVLRVNTAGHTDIQSYLAHIKDVHLAAQSHQDVPFEQLVEHLQLPRDTGHNPLVQILFSMDEDISGKGPLALGDIKVEMLEDEQAAVKCDLDISAGLDEQGLHLSWLYDSALFDRAHIAQLQAHFERLLRQAVTLTPGRPDTFRLLSQAEQSALLAAGEGQQAASDVALLPTQFSAQAGRHGSRIALQWQDQTLSYDALEQRANQLARLLRERGVGAEQRVGIYLPRSIDMVVAMLGVLKAGGAYVPIDPAYPQQRVAHILADTEMAQLLTHSDLAAQLTTTSVTCIALDEAKTQACLRGYSDTRLDITVEPEDLAYVIYTSGSTGTPKGVMVEHKQLAHYIQFAMAEYGGAHLQGAVVSTSQAFDATVTSLFYPLMTGKTVYLTDQTEAGIEQLQAQLQDTQPWLFKLTPAHLHLLQQLPWQNEHTDTAHVVVVGGEQLSTQAMRVWCNRLPNTRFINEYGPTEAAVGCCIKEISAQQPLCEHETVVAIGRPIARTRLYVLDHNLALVPQGAVGELYIAGEGVARGYLGQAELTQTRFIANPFSDEPHYRTLYKTGDRVKWLDNDELQYLERMDDQVKIRGHRVQLSEIDEHIQQLDGVQMSLTLHHAQTLISFVQPLQVDLKLESVALRQALAEQLPGYMLPQQVVRIEHWPLTANGKFDTTALLALAAQVKPQHSSAGISNPVEQRIADIWCKLLHCDSLSIDDDFFSVGGHSITLVALMVSLNKAFQRSDVTIERLLQSSTIRAQAQWLSTPAKTVREVSPLTALNLPESAGQSGPCKLIVVFPGAALASHNYVAFGQAATDAVYVAEPWSGSQQGCYYKSLEDQVTQVCQWLLTHHKSDKVTLVGHSFGGFVAFSVAHELTKKGLDVSLNLVESLVFNTSDDDFKDEPDWVQLGQELNSDRAHAELLEAQLKVTQGLYQRQLGWAAEYRFEERYAGPVRYIFSTENTYFKEVGKVIENVQQHCLQQVSVAHVEGDHFSLFDERHSAALLQALC